MEEQQRVLDAEAIRNRSFAITGHQLGAVMSPCGIVFLFIALLDILTIWKEKAGWEAMSAAWIAWMLAQLTLLACMIAIPILAGVLIQVHLSCKVGTWVPKLQLTRREWTFLGIGLITLITALGVQYLPAMEFPWFGLAWGCMYSVSGVMDAKLRRWYYPAIALPLMGLCFLPMLLGFTNAEPGWTRVTCFGAYAALLILVGWLDLVHLQRLLKPAGEVADARTV